MIDNDVRAAALGMAGANQMDTLRGMLTALSAADRATLLEECLRVVFELRSLEGRLGA